MTVLDTSFLVALEGGSDGAEALLDDLRERRDALRVPGAVWTEYLSGFDPIPREEARAVLEAEVTFEAFTRTLADEAARLQAELADGGEPLGWHDLQVATTALHHDEPVVTVDAGFEAVPGLGVLSVEA